MPESLFAELKRRLAAFQGDVIPFHIGDSHLDPPAPSRLGNLGFSCGSDPDMYRYAPAPGKAQLIGRVRHKVRRENGMEWAEDDCVQITSGATHALFCAVRAVQDYGDEMLLLAPHWPLMRGIAASAGVVPVEVPFSHVLLRDPSATIADLIEPFITMNTTVIYLSNPNNPDGKVYTRAELEAIGKIAVRHNLWVIADEVYERFVYGSAVHTSIANLPGMRERTLTVFSMSKTYALPGLRVGYIVAPALATDAIRNMSHHSIYSVPRAMQRAALAAMEHGEEFITTARATYESARDYACAHIQAPCIKPDGSTYLFLDLSAHCLPAEPSCLGVLTRFAEAGVLLAPGEAFGSRYPKWARLCFTSVGRPLLEAGIERLNRVLSS